MSGQRCTVQWGEDLLATLAHDSTGDPDIHLASLEQAIADAGVVVTRQNLGGAFGCSQPGRVTILESLTPADTAAVLVHEFAHLCSVVGYVDSGDGVGPVRSPAAAYM